MIARVLSVIRSGTAATSSQLSAENWPQWRGPRGTGVSRETDLPIFWSENRHVSWRTPLPGAGASSPIVWEQSVFVTCQADDGRQLLLRIDAGTGRILWQRELGRSQPVREATGRQQQKFHRLHNHASPTPATDGTTVVAHFGDGRLAACDFSGKVLWQRNLAEDFGRYTVWWGHANSPLIHRGAVISTCLQDSLSDLGGPTAESYLVAHDLRDGHVRWKRLRTTGARAEQGDAYTTPLLVEAAGRCQLVVMGGTRLDATDPVSGAVEWELDGLISGRTVCSPTAGQGMVFATLGMKGDLIAVQLGGSGELSHRDIVWKYRQGTSDSASPVVWDTLLFFVTDDGLAKCLDAMSGYIRWRHRLPGQYKASPVAVDGRIVFLNTDGLATVVSATARFDRLTENRLDDQMLASPAIAGGRIFLRGQRTLYCLAGP